MIEHLAAAFLALIAFWPMFYLILGTLVGIIVGAIPGLNGATIIALSLPLTFFMDHTNALILLVAMYVGSTAGGLISATLMRMPGTPNAIMTVLDGYPMAKAGRAGRALGLGIYASFAGGLISWFFLALLSPPLADLGVKFGPYEIFSMVVVALCLIAAISSGTLIKGLLAALFGVMVAMVGEDKASGNLRLTFGWEELEPGFGLLPVILGMMVLSQVVADSATIGAPVERQSLSIRGMLLPVKEFLRYRWLLLRSSLIGTWIGILPGIGTTTAAIASYSVARMTAKDPDRFGKGAEEGIIAAETANNAAVNGALVPLIALGIPGSVVDVILLGALIIHNLQPGPLLFTSNPDVVYGIIAAALVANVMMLVLMLAAVPWFARVMNVHRGFLLPAIVVFCILGALAESNRMFDIGVMFAFGAVGFAMIKSGVPIGPFIIGFILGPIAEEELRRGLMAYDGSYLPLVTRPLSAIFLVVALVTLAFPFVANWRRRRIPEAD